MITFSKLGQHGNLGNQLFQIASLIGLGKEFNHEVVIPEWQYKDYFYNIPPTQKINAQKLEEIHYHYDLSQFKELSNSGNYDLLGWLQSEKYFYNCTIFKLKDSAKHDIPTIGLSVRRGDYVDNPNYELLEINYYLNALQKFNLTHYRVMVFSDDIEYCKIHFSCLDNVVFSEGNAIQQLINMAKCHAFVIANSTFSWWGAYLGNEITVRPNCLFNGELLKNDDKDFYPSKWIVQDYKEKINLKDATFIIPVKYDHSHREENLLLTISYLQKYFDTNIIVGEICNHFSWLSKHVNYVQFDLKKFHRTKMLNELTMLSNTPYVINWDADVFVSPVQLWQTLEMLRSGVDFVYPYDGRFARVPRTRQTTLNKYLDVGMLKETFNGMRSTDFKSVGGAIAYNKQSFIKAGGENENFISYGAEDVERKYRFETLGFEVQRVKGVLYHLDHAITTDSSTKHDDFKGNEQEYNKLVKMNKEKLQEYVSTWQPISTSKKINTNKLVPLEHKIISTMKITLKKDKIGGLAVIGKTNIKLRSDITQAELELLYDKMPHLVDVEVQIEKKKQDDLVELNTPTTSTLTEQPKEDNSLSEALPEQTSKRKGGKQKMATK